MSSTKPMDITVETRATKIVKVSPVVLKLRDEIHAAVNEKTKTNDYFHDYMYQASRPGKKETSKSVDAEGAVELVQVISSFYEVK